jgi:hypothetical protein
MKLREICWGCVEWILLAQDRDRGGIMLVN